MPAQLCVASLRDFMSTVAPVPKSSVREEIVMALSILLARLHKSVQSSCGLSP